MHALTLSLLLLPTALAHRHRPGYGHILHHHPFSGTAGSSGAPVPSATSNAPYGSGNTTTSLGSTGFVTAVSTISSATVPESSVIGGSSAVPTTSANAGVNVGSPGGSSIDGASSEPCDSSVVTVTSNPIVTVTVTPGQGSTAADVPSSSLVLPASSAAPASSQSSVPTVLTGVPVASPTSSAAPIVQTSSTESTSTSTTAEKPTSSSLLEATVASSSKPPVTSQSTVTVIPIPATEVKATTPTSSAQTPKQQIPATIVSSSTTPKQSTTSSRGSAGGCPGKRGIIATAGGNPQTYDQGNISLAYASEPNICWIANWYSAPPPKWNPAKEFVPQDYGISSKESEWHNNAKQAIAKGAKTFLSFGEPEADGRDHMEPQQAVDLYMKLMQPYAKDVKLCSPAVLQPREHLDWLAEFLDLCGKAGCTIDMICIHWYDTTSKATPGFPEFKRTVDNATALANGKKVWVDNFQANGSPEDVKTFLDQALPYLEGNSNVERYAYVPPLRTDPCKKQTCQGYRTDQFIDPDLNSQGKLTELGKYYANFKMGA